MRKFSKEPEALRNLISSIFIIFTCFIIFTNFINPSSTSLSTVLSSTPASSFSQVSSFYQSLLNLIIKSFIIYTYYIIFTSVSILSIPSELAAQRRPITGLEMWDTQSRCRSPSALRAVGLENIKGNKWWTSNHLTVQLNIQITIVTRNELW